MKEFYLHPFGVFANGERETPKEGLDECLKDLKICAAAILNNFMAQRCTIKKESKGVK